MVAFARQAEASQADLILFPELSLTGYPPEDLLLRPGFLGQVDEALQQLAQASSQISLVVGHPQVDDHGRLYNAASLLQGGELVLSYHKQELPNYGVFDEKR